MTNRYNPNGTATLATHMSNRQKDRVIKHVKAQKTTLAAYIRELILKDLENVDTNANL